MSGELILIIEDNEKNLKLLRDVLTVTGYRTMEATTAENGIVMARAHRPALVLMDIRLPGMDGITALKHLRADPATQKIPVVAVTASVMTEQRDEILSAGFDGYHAKPIKVKELTEAVGKMLAGKLDVEKSA